MYPPLYSLTVKDMMNILPHTFPMREKMFSNFFEHKPLPGTLMVGRQFKAPALTPPSLMKQ